MKMFNKIIKIKLLTLLIFTLGCANLFSEMSDKTTDKARFYEAKLKLGKGDWDAAIEQIDLMTPDYQDRREVKVLKASAYSGKCGLDFIALANTLQNGGSTAFFSLLMTAYTGKTAVDLESCIESEDILKSIGDHTVRNSSENLLMAFNALVKIGVVLNARGDVDADGTIDAGWTPCGGDGATDFPADDAPTSRTDAAEIVTGVALFITSLTAAGAGDSAGDTFQTINTICSALGAGNPCSIVDRADVDSGNPHTRAIRSMIVEDTDGIGLGIDACDTATCYAVNCSAF